MLKLKAIINQLETDSIESLEKQLIQNKADNLLFLFQEYKKNEMTDADIIKHLNYNISSFHTLKSRLFDKIQTQLINDSFDDRSNILIQLSNIPKYCYETPREIAEAILQKMEESLKIYGMSGDLITVYSALKKIHLHTQKYYEYSQLYNKHLAYTMALEKAEELLGSFIKALSEYYLSKSPAILEMLNLIRKEISNIYQLNKSNHIEVIHNTIIIHLNLFTSINKNSKEATSDLLDRTEKIILKFSNNTLYKPYSIIISFLQFEYYTQISEHNKAQKYFDEVNASLKNWLLLDNLCLAFHFLLSKVNNYCIRGIENTLDAENQEISLFSDSNNTLTNLYYKFYCSVSKFYAGKFKECSALINDILNTTSFKYMLNAELEIKLFLAYNYVMYNEFELATGIIRSLYRKIKSQNEYEYENAIAFSKVLLAIIDFDESEKMKQKIEKLIRQFQFENSCERELMKFLEKDLERLKVSFSR
jgi:hypothetical protein